MKEEMVDAQGLAAHLKVSLRMVRNWEKAGAIPCRFLTGTGKKPIRRYVVSEVEDWLAKRVERTNPNRYPAPAMGIYLRKTGKNASPVYQYAFTVNGERHTGSTHEKDKAKAEECLMRLKLAVMEGVSEGGRSRITLKEAIEGYHKYSGAENKPSTVRAKQHLATIVLRHMDGGRRLSSFVPADIAQFKMDRKAEKAKGKKSPPSESTINKGLNYLQGLFSWAKAMGKVSASPFDLGTKATARYKEEVPVWRHLQPAEKQRLLEGCNETIQPIVTTAFGTGMRRGELLALTWRQVDLAQKTIQVVNTKSKRKRTLKMGQALVELFKRLPKRSEYVFTREDGSPLNEGYLSHHFERAMEWAEVSDFSFHGTRRVFATEFYHRTKDIRALQKILGHSTISTTERYLATLGIVEDSEAIEAICDEATLLATAGNAAGTGPVKKNDGEDDDEERMMVSA